MSTSNNTPITQLRFVLDHHQSLAPFTEAGHPYPSIPSGKNSIWHHFVTVDGYHAVIINQSGFMPRASDNEEQPNGCTLIVALNPPDAAAARATLEAQVRELLKL